MKLVLPYPPSANASYRAIVRGKFSQVIQSRQLREFKSAVALASAAQGSESQVGHLSFLMKLYRPRRIGDIDNYIKPTFDSLNGIAFEDDSQIRHLGVWLYDDKSNPRAEVTIQQFIDTPALAGSDA